MDKTIFIIAGEPSADMHGAHLVKELKSRSSNLKIYGIGSTNMRQQGVSVFVDLAQYAVIGFLEVLRHYPIYKNAFNLTLKKIKELSPEAIILIDYPGFNLRLAKRIRKDFPHLKIIYYISPQIWAWGGRRILLIKKIVDHMIVLFEFEKKLYQKNNIPVTFTGHPLLDSMQNIKPDETLRKQLNLKNNDIIIGILPGSREVEVKRLLPVMLESAKIIHEKLPNIKFVLIKGEHIKQSFIDKTLNFFPGLPIYVAKNNRYNHLKLCSFAWVCSGTATLETAILEVPMLIVYKTSFITWLISKMLIELPYIGLINVIAGKKIVEELIQFKATPQNISRYSVEILKDKNRRIKICNDIITAKQKLGNPGANSKAAHAISSLLSTTD